MVVLALETSLELVSCAVWDGANQRLRAEVQAYAYQNLTQRLPALVATTLNEAEVTLDNVDLIGVSLGPGSFTSVRVGLAFAKGLAMALGKPLLGVRTLEALAWAACGNESDLLLALYPSRPSRPTEVYSALFRKDGDDLFWEGTEQACDIAQLVTKLQERPETNIVVVGVLPSGARQILMKRLLGKRIALPLTPLFPSAQLVAQVAWRRWHRTLKPDDPVRLVPIYVLPSSAEERMGMTVAELLGNNSQPNAEEA